MEHYSEGFINGMVVMFFLLVIFGVIPINDEEEKPKSKRKSKNK